MADDREGRGSTMIAAGASLVLCLALAAGTFYCGWGLLSVGETYHGAGMQPRGMARYGTAMLGTITLLLALGAGMFGWITLACVWSAARKKKAQASQAEEEARHWRSFPTPKD